MFSWLTRYCWHAIIVRNTKRFKILFENESTEYLSIGSFHILKNTHVILVDDDNWRFQRNPFDNLDAFVCATQMCWNVQEIMEQFLTSRLWFYRIVRLPWHSLYFTIYCAEAVLRWLMFVIFDVTYVKLMHARNLPCDSKYCMCFSVTFFCTIYTYIIYYII